MYEIDLFLVLNFQEDENPKITSNDNETAQTDASTQQQNIHNSQLAATAKKPDHQMKQQLQPTSEQLMIAQLIAGNDEKADDPNQRQKIQQVMDITGKAEEIVATALFDAGWDENLAVGMLLEGGDQLTAWEETGKGGKKKKQQKSQASDDKVRQYLENNLYDCGKISDPSLYDIEFKICKFFLRMSGMRVTLGVMTQEKSHGNEDRPE